METRIEKKLKWSMANNNSTWISTGTLKNIDLIYRFLTKESEGKRKKPMFSYLQLAKKLNLGNKQVQFACQKLGFREIPLIKIIAVSYGSSKGVKVSEKVQLIDTTK